MRITSHVGDLLGTIFDVAIGGYLGAEISSAAASLQTQKV